MLVSEGPYATPFKFHLVTDNRSRSPVDLGSDLGGKMDATAEIRGNTLTTFLKKKGKSQLFMTATRTIHPGTFYFIEQN